LTGFQDKGVNLLETEVFSIIVSLRGFVLYILFVPRRCNSFLLCSVYHHSPPPILIFCCLFERPVHYEITWV